MLIFFSSALHLQNKPTKTAKLTNVKNKLPKLAATAAGSIDESVEYHYKFALKLRKNFPLAALNLGAYQYGTLNQLAEALSTFDGCANQMSPKETRAFQRHVRVQIECLISGAKLQLSTLSEATSSWSSSSWLQRLSHAKLSAAEISGLQTNGATKQTTAVDGSPKSAAKKSGAFKSAATDQQQQQHPPTDIGGGCRKVLDWTNEARKRLNQIGSPDATIDRDWQTPVFLLPVELSELSQLADLSKQLATIHWIEAQCFELIGGQQQLIGVGDSSLAALLDCKQQRDPKRERDCAFGLVGEKLKKAVEFAWRSQVSIEAKIYISYADFLMLDQQQQQGELEASRLLRRSIELEESKNKLMVGQQQQQQHLLELGRLRFELAKITSKKKPEEALSQLEQACRHVPNQFHWLTLAGQLAYELGQLTSSESFYLQAVQVASQEAAEEMNDGKATTTTTTTNACEGTKPRDVDLAHRKLASAHANYGAILQVRGRLEEAREQYRRSLDCNPFNEVGATNLAWLNERTRMVKRAKEPSRTRS